MEKYVQILYVKNLNKIGEKMNKKIILILIATTLVSVFLVGCISTPESELNLNMNSNPSQQTDTEIFIPLSELSTSAKFYYSESDGVKIHYFAVKDVSGNPHFAFDACDVCYQAKKGYQQNGNVMHCNNCGREFQITSIGTENLAGGCWPSYLPIKIDDDKVVIKIVDLLEKQYMFE